jgi:hypothetical protein
VLNHLTVLLPAAEGVSTSVLNGRKKKLTNRPNSPRSKASSNPKQSNISRLTKLPPQKKKTVLINRLIILHSELHL